MYLIPRRYLHNLFVYFFVHIIINIYLYMGVLYTFVCTYNFNQIIIIPYINFKTYVTNNLLT